MSPEVEKWMKRTKKKGPFYLLKEDFHEYFIGKWDEDNKPIRAGGFLYQVIWKENGKVKLGDFRDGMSCRYGVSTWATLSTPSPTGLWQATSGCVSMKELQHMIDLFQGEIMFFKTFDPETIKGLSW